MTLTHARVGTPPFLPTEHFFVDFQTGTSNATTSFLGDIDPGFAAGLSTLVDFARAHAKSDLANQPLFSYVESKPGEHERITFAEMDVKARAIAAAIQSRGATGKPVLVVLDPGIDYASSIYGCMYAKAIAVPVYPPQMLRMQHTLPRLKAIIDNSDAKLMLSSRATIDDSRTALWGLPSENAIAVDEVELGQSDNWHSSLPSANDIAILQYTSGSTGNPSGVVLRHKTILQNLEALRLHFHFEGVRCVQWIPPYHDMGLITGILVPQYVGVETVLMSPASFVRDPLLWLQCIDHYKGTSNGAPNFGYELCIRKIKDSDCEGLDLSSWKVAVSGAEPVRANTLRRFTEKFAPFGFEPTTFCPSFGMAETTVIVSGSPLGQEFKTYEVDSDVLHHGTVQTVTDASCASQTLVSSGTPVRGLEVRIVNPETCYEVQDGEIGEIWIRGSSVADGYWRDEAKTKERFNASIAGSSEGGFLRSGDLGSMVEGELIVTGRCKELIIVAGKNLYPHDVEYVVQSTSDAFKSDTGIAFGLDTGNSEELVVVQEVWRPKKFNTEELLQNAVSAIFQNLHVTPHAILLVRSGSMPKTSSGKLQRGDLREMYLKNELPEIARWQADEGASAIAHEFAPPATDTEKKVASLWQDILGVDEIGREDDFFHLGGGSLLVVQLLTIIKENFDVDLPLTSLFRDSTLSAFCAAIDASNTGNKTNIIPRSELADDQPHPLSTIQQRFWLLSELGQTDAFLHVPVTIKLSGKLDETKLQSAVDALIAKHAMLRTYFGQLGDEVVQCIASDAKAAVEFCDAKSEKEFSEWRIDFIERPFDLNKPPLMRVGLWRNESNPQIEMVFHHIVCDASSVELLLSDVKRAFDDELFCCDDAALRYVDFCAWDQSEPRNEDIAASTEYWKERLAGIPSQLSLPPATEQSDDLPSVVAAQLNRHQTVQLQNIALDHGVTVSMLYLTAMQCVLSRYTGSADLTFALPTSNRPATGLAETVGCYVNPLIYRAQIKADQSITKMLAETRENLLQDLQHGHVPFQNVIEVVPHERSLGTMPLAQSMFLYQPELKTIDSLGEATVTSITPDYSAVTAYDLSLIVHPTPETEISLVFGDKVDRSTANRILQSLISVLQQFATGGLKNLTVESLVLPAAAERDVLNSAENGSRIDIGNESVLTRLSHHASETPNAIAITDDSQQITYAELEKRSTLFAAALVERGLKPATLAGIKMPRSTNLVTTILGIWKAGAGYVPLDPKLPEARIDEMIRDAEVSLVIDEDLYAELSSEDIEATLPETDPRSLAYVIYTSGSTGVPKGVAIEHFGVANLLESFTIEPGMKSEHSVLAVTTMAFDISVLEMFLPIWSGAQSRITAHSVAEDPDAVIDTIAQSGVTHIQSTPSTFRMLLASGWKPSKDVCVLCGGEPMMPDVAKELLDAGCELWNVYGPTETTVWSAVDRIESADDITIGHPIANTDLLILDEQNQRAPLGVAGELLIGGAGLARGYWKRDELTAERFVTLHGRRLYRTGDQARRRNDGRIEFLARNDRQIKLRGFRVELDEIESVLQQHDDVQRAAVVLRVAANDTKTLVGFCETPNGEDMADAILRFASQKLPAYMLPLIKCTHSLPKTNAGKTDYQALPTDDLNQALRPKQPPQTPLESSIAEAWCEVLSCDSVGRDENFFDLGGNSLMAAQLFSRIRELFGVHLPLKEVYQRPTVEALAGLIVQQQSQDKPDELSELLDKIDSLSEEEALRAFVNDTDE